jgi:hypothetical protein
MYRGCMGKGVERSQHDKQNKQTNKELFEWSFLEKEHLDSEWSCFRSKLIQDIFGLRESDLVLQI